MTGLDRLLSKLDTNIYSCQYCGNLWDLELKNATYFLLNLRMYKNTSFGLVSNLLQNYRYKSCLSSQPSYLVLA